MSIPVQTPSVSAQALSQLPRGGSLYEGGSSRCYDLLPVHPAPTIVCCDLWPPGALTQAKLTAYKRLIDTGDVRIRRVIYHKPTGYTTVDYWSNLPHAWTLNRLRELAATLDQGTQTRLEGI